MTDPRNYTVRLRSHDGLTVRFGVKSKYNLLQVIEIIRMAIAESELSSDLEEFWNNGEKTEVQETE